MNLYCKKNVLYLNKKKLSLNFASFQFLKYGSNYFGGRPHLSFTLIIANFSELSTSTIFSKL